MQIELSRLPGANRTVDTVGGVGLVPIFDGIQFRPQWI